MEVRAAEALRMEGRRREARRSEVTRPGDLHRSQALNSLIFMALKKIYLIQIFLIFASWHCSYKNKIITTFIIRKDDGRPRREDRSRGTTRASCFAKNERRF